WRRRHPDFPTPIGGTESRPTYDLDMIRAWLAERDQLPTDSPADELRTALHGEPAPHRLWPVVLAGHRIDDADLKAALEAPDTDVAALLRDLVASYAHEVPGAADSAYPPETLHAIRALLRCLLSEGATSTVDLLGDAVGSHPAG